MTRMMTSMVPIDMIYLWLQRLSAPTERQLIYINDDYLCASHYRHIPGLGLSKGSARPSRLWASMGIAKFFEEEIMDKDRIIGSAKQVKGAVKQAVGKAVGDAKLESEGKADKIEGKVQNAVGGIKDTLKGK